MLSIDPKREVQDSVYGYSSLVSGLKVKLQAVAKDYCIVYTIDREQIQDIISQSERDFEYYHLIKARIETSKAREEWELPEVRNIREHYSPNPYYVLKKDRLENKSMRRRFRFRQSKKVSFIIQAELLNTENEMSGSEDENKRGKCKRAKTSNDLARVERRTRFEAVVGGKIMISTRDQRHKLKRK
jgi:signal-transduction protein with cAMP-binding, CBS, and nucleotidyltransferase domain